MRCDKFYLVIGSHGHHPHAMHHADPACALHTCALGACCLNALAKPHLQPTELAVYKLSLSVSFVRFVMLALYNTSHCKALKYELYNTILMVYM